MAAQITVTGEDSDLLRITPLGAGQEVGRSCIFLEFKGKKILLDLGIHPAYTGLDSLPFIDEIDPKEVDLLLISHFHLDHCGGLPWFLEKTHFKGRVFMTHPTKAIYRWLLADYIKVSNLSADQMLYTEKDLDKSMDKIETIHFHQEKEVGGIKFWAYNAGHVLGAAMFMIEIAGVNILYTGDFSRQEDRHLMSAEIPSISPDVLICEATYGTHVHERRDQREKRFTSSVHNIINRGGRCLIPVFALGRAQELLLILDEYWTQHPELQDVPVYYASSLAKKCMAVYQTFIGAMNERIRRQISISNPFVFKHISNLKGIDSFDDIGPSVVMASPGMMQSGLSRELFETWCTDPRNGVIIAGYCVEGTLAKDLMSEPEEVTAINGQRMKRNMSINYISFSAHVDYEQVSDFINILRPPHIVLNHGEANEMGRLKAALLRDFEDRGITNMQVYNPKNCQSVKLHFRGEKMAKVIGSLASGKPSHGKPVSGVLLKRGFNYHVMAPSDLPNYTELAISSIKQRQIIDYHASFTQLTTALKNFSGKVETFLHQGKPAIRLFDGIISIFQERNAVVLEWASNPTNDMFADAVVVIVLEVENHPSQVKSLNNTNLNYQQHLLKLLNSKYGEKNVIESEQGDIVTVDVDGTLAIIDLETLSVDCTDEHLRNLVSAVVNNLNMAMTPLTA
ncbi:cleavage and polyadenylation specificity factor subunit 3-like [Clytia hemisphaerica]|uniref:Cleavage and polyadenylation specificity factor subunit 3 n=1 Tax=Clytia hemisphaerica TaxID=252671 RepID=A0A7M5U9F1_9CNID